jgi:hypothetical protein
MYSGRLLPDDRS